MASLVFKRSLLLLLLSISPIAKGQQLVFSSTVMNNPGDLMLLGETSSPPELDEGSLPIIRISPGLYWGDPKAAWRVFTKVVYQHVRQSTEIDPGPFEDPLSQIFFQRRLNFLGLEVGPSYQKYLGSGTDAVRISTGLVLLMPFASKDGFVVNDRNNLEPVYTEGGFSKGVFYGALLEVGYTFSPSKKRSSPLRLGIVARADGLLLNTAESNPKLLYGGGLELVYTIR